MKTRHWIVVIALVAAAAGGWWAGTRSGPSVSTASTQASGSGPCPDGAQPLYWKAPMDPTYVRDEPGKSPMGMDLVPVCPGEGAAVGGGGVQIDPMLVQNMGVRLAPVTRRDLSRQVRAVGRVDYDERLVDHVHTKIQGWVEKLYVEYEGEMVKRGQPMLEIYSPELLSTQEERLVPLHEGPVSSASGGDLELAIELVAIQRESGLCPGGVPGAKAGGHHASWCPRFENVLPDLDRALGMDVELEAHLLTGVARARDQDVDASQSDLGQLKAAQPREAIARAGVVAHFEQRRQSNGNGRRDCPTPAHSHGRSGCNERMSVSFGISSLPADHEDDQAFLDALAAHPVLGRDTDRFVGDSLEHLSPVQAFPQSRNRPDCFAG